MPCFEKIFSSYLQNSFHGEKNPVAMLSAQHALSLQKFPLKALWRELDLDNQGPDRSKATTVP